MILKGLGVDVVEIKRLKPFKKDKKSPFLLNNYSKKELAYCFSFEDPGPHLAGIFAAKEAVFKALDQGDTPLWLIEIRRRESGQPTVWVKNRFQKSIFVSISHTTKIAVAVAIKY